MLLRDRFRLLSLFVSVLLLLGFTACGGNNNSASNTGSNSGSTPTPGSSNTGGGSGGSTSSAQQYLFAPLGNDLQQTSSGPNAFLAEYKVDGSTGALTLVNNKIQATNLATFTARDAGHKFLYVEGSPQSATPALSYNTISGYTVAQSDGALTPMPGSPFDFNHQELAFMTVRPDLKFAYVEDYVNAGTVHIIAMDPGSGALKNEVSTVTIPEAKDASVLAAASFDSSGQYLYFAISEKDAVAAYKSDATTGALTPVPGSPFVPKGAVAGGCSPKSRFCQADVVKVGSKLYFVGQFYDGVAVFDINSTTGTLTESANSPVSNPAHQGEVLLATPNGKFLYVLAPGAGGGMIVGYSIDANGGLTQVGSPLSGIGIVTFAEDMDESGKFLYAATDTGIVGYSIDQSTGALAPVPGSPYAAGGVTGVTVVH